MLLQNDFNMNSLTIPLIFIIFMLLLIISMLYLYFKERLWIFILIDFLFSIIIGTSALNFSMYIPFTPILQVFFILIQTIIFILSSIDLYKQEFKYN